jgi:hypothetical protein
VHGSEIGNAYTVIGYAAWLTLHPLKDAMDEVVRDTSAFLRNIGSIDAGCGSLRAQAQQARALVRANQRAASTDTSQLRATPVRNPRLGEPCAKLRAFVMSGSSGCFAERRGTMRNRVRKPPGAIWAKTTRGNQPGAVRNRPVAAALWIG